MQNEDLKLTLEEIAQRQTNYQRYSDYYAGRHPLNFATDKFRKTFGAFFGALKDNLCPIVIDTLVDRLEVINFSAESGADRAAQNPQSIPAWAVWQRNRMEQRAAEIFREAFKTGDSYAIVWADEEGRATIHPNRAENVTVIYDEETGLIRVAAKMWRRVDKRWRLNLYYADRIEKYLTRQPSEEHPTSAKSFEPFETPDEPFPMVNPFGEIPVFHFVNKPGLGFFGASELKDVDSLQDALNKSLCDMFVAKEFVAFPQRWATRVEPDYDENGKLIEPFKTGVDRIWSVANEAARFGQFEPASLEQFLKVQESLRFEVARISGTPLHFFLMQTGNVPSGEALKTLESRFQAKVKNAQLVFGQTLANMMKFALKVEGTPVEELELVTQWANSQPHSEKEHLETLLLKQQLGAPAEMLLSEAGYAAEDIAGMKYKPESPA